MASVSYKITGKYDSSAVKKAKTSLSSLGSVAKNLKGIFAGLGAIFAFKKIVDFSKECTNAFSVQEAALNRLGQAVNNNRNLTENSLKRIIAYTGKLQSKSIYGDEVLQGHAAYLTAMGLEEKQIKNVLNAAVELSSAGVGNLESNVKNLSKTLSGHQGQLGELIPELKNLTKEQLTNGEAVDIVSRKYAGFAENLSQNTLQGVSAQFNNLTGDIKEKLGSITGILQFNGMKKMLPILDDINNWLDKNKNKVINIFLNLPDVAAASFSLIKDIFRKIFTVEGFTQYIKIVFTNFLTVAKNTLVVLFNLIKAIGITIWEPLKIGLEWTAYGIKTLFASIINFFIEKINSFVDGLTKSINWCIEKINGVRKLLGQDNIKKFGESTKIQLIAHAEKPKEVNTQNIWDSWKDVGASIVEGVKSNYEANKKFAGEMSKLFGKEFGTFFKTVDKIMNRPVQTGENKTVKTENNISSTRNDSAGKLTKNLEDALNSLGQIGQMIKSIMSKNWIGLVISLVGTFVSALSNVSPAFNDFINSISYVMQIVAERIAPIIDRIFLPLLDLFILIAQTIGEVLVPVLEIAVAILEPIINIACQVVQVLSPVLSLFASLAKLFITITPILEIFSFALKILGQAIGIVYNVIIVPIVNVLVHILSAIGNFVIVIWNAICSVLNSINIFGWRPFNLQKKNYINAGDYTLSKVDTSISGGKAEGKYSKNGEAGGNSSKGASYTAAKDIYVNIYFQNSYVNGDARAIALSIRDEIKSAERAGY